jgi:hypothetical protein
MAKSAVTKLVIHGCHARANTTKLAPVIEAKTAFKNITAYRGDSPCKPPAV